MESHSVLAFLHRPLRPAPAGAAVLLCPPFGWQEICSYRIRRTWAQELAAAGHTAARIDLPGCGDSSGSPHDPDLVRGWLDTITAAAGWLRELAGAERLVAIGIASGGLLACRALQQGAPIDELVLWGVPARGRTLVRELRAQAALVPAPDVEGSVAAMESPADGPGLELTGYVLSGATAGDLSQIDLTADASLPAPRRALLLRRDGLKADERLTEFLRAAGTDLAIAEGPGYGELTVEPEWAKFPAQTVARTLAWLSAAAPAAGRPAAAQAPAPAVERDRLQVRHDGITVHERPLEVPHGEGRLFGVITEPAAEADTGLCALFLSGGGHRHTGPNRAWVEVARRWAGRGVACVRADLEDIGDSDGRRGPLVLADVYTEARTEQVRSILAELRRELPGRRFVLVGLCSGAYAALHAAVADPSVSDALLINLYAFRFSEALVAERDRRAAARALRGNYFQRLRSGGFRRDLVLRALRSLHPARAPLIGSSQEAAQRPEAERVLGALHARGTRVLFLLATREPLHDQLVRHGFLERLLQWPELTVERIPLQDHIFRARWAQRHVHARLDAALERALDAAPAPARPGG